MKSRVVRINSPIEPALRNAPGTFVPSPARLDGPGRRSARRDQPNLDRELQNAGDGDRHVASEPRWPSPAPCPAADPPAGRNRHEGRGAVHEMQGIGRSATADQKGPANGVVEGDEEHEGEDETVDREPVVAFAA